MGQAKANNVGNMVNKAVGVDIFNVTLDPKNIKAIVERLSVYSLNSELESYPLVTDDVVTWWTQVMIGTGETIPMPELRWSHVGVLEFTSYENVVTRGGAFKYSKDVMVWTVV